MNCYAYCTSSLLILIVAIAGCGSGGYPPVSGKVTMDGKPVPLVSVVFAPVGSTENPEPGPYSRSMTDAQGNFSLRTRHDKRGAVPGPHRVGIEYDNADEMSDLKFQLSEADSEARDSIKKEINELRSLIKSRIKIPRNSAFEFVVPKEGTSAANFELNSQ